jgi:hypothetical protein|tara:strand:+ start:2671 stop:3795 length:1125 start_codon:yes stop_codon:yes gene_type:complete
MRIITLALIGLLTTASQAGAKIGTVTEINGFGEIVRESNVVGNREGTPLESMDTARTKRGKMRLDFIDDTRVDVIDNSILVIDDFVYDPATGTGKLDMRAALGTVRYASGQIAKNSRQNVRVRTPSATISVRGTDFIMVVDEIGGSMVTLLPSCDTRGYCVTGEIKVETDEGFVLLNQAFQATQVSHRGQMPSNPVIIDLGEDQINNLLILRKKTVIEEEEDQIRKRTRAMFEFLDIDALEFDGLDEDALVDDIKNIWATELDHNADYYLGELLYDMIDQLNAALSALFRDELKTQNEQFFDQKLGGYDEKTRITLINQDPSWIITRTSTDVENYIRLDLNQEYGYAIDIEQSDELILDYRLGAGNNSINIKQK